MWNWKTKIFWKNTPNKQPGITLLYNFLLLIRLAHKFKSSCALHISSIVAIAHSWHCNSHCFCNRWDRLESSSDQIVSWTWVLHFFLCWFWYNTPTYLWHGFINILPIEQVQLVNELLICKRRVFPSQGPCSWLPAWNIQHNPPPIAFSRNLMIAHCDTPVFSYGVNELHWSYELYLEVCSPCRKLVCFSPQSASSSLGTYSHRAEGNSRHQWCEKGIVRFCFVGMQLKKQICIGLQLLRWSPIKLRQL